MWRRRDGDKMARTIWALLAPRTGVSNPGTGVDPAKGEEHGELPLQRKGTLKRLRKD